MTDAREQVIAGLEAAIRDINCPLQYSPLMMEAARLLRKFSPPEPTEPHPRWKPSDKSDRHPQSVEEWDTSKDPVGEALDRSRRRLNVAGDYDDPRAPPQMALVLRGDITRLIHDWIHKNAVFDIWVKEREDMRALALQDHGWRDIDTAPKDGTMIILWVEAIDKEDSCHPTENAMAWRTIGFNNLEHDGDDIWKFSGWCWQHDHFVEGDGAPTKWMPMPPPAAPAMVAEKRGSECSSVDRDAE